MMHQGGPLPAMLVQASWSTEGMSQLRWEDADPAACKMPRECLQEFTSCLCCIHKIARSKDSCPD